MAIKHESELYEPIKQYYEQRGYTVKGEVLRCDLVAIREGTDSEEDMLIVEMKKTFNLALLLQGVERLRLSCQVVLAVERNRSKRGAHNQRFGELAELCRMLGLGLMTVTFYKTKQPQIEMLCEPGDTPRRTMRRARASRTLREFKERSGDYNTGGVTGRKLMTAYKEKALRCAWALQQLGPSAPRAIAAHTDVSQAGAVLRNNYYGWFERSARGVYQLRSPGEQALAEHAAVIAAWLEASGRAVLPPSL
ncbi:DUF2161 family putative PD-(D/E)XK-type phosphodiesterase [Paenibacillus sp. SYP-B4298]|uniref:DUF2161 family putative PD-(D/E)XK-type phosphodiesterase n=1 Tax=Paenibacillus sp. SYP-B4298 TaxID=2996034 RepID=UPI0022DE36ED|nr:DUF2161 family putative PD-(D/E)XK-type phosphodiesterase [Paenibacillus sp. SYP-B4298]